MNAFIFYKIHQLPFHELLINLYFLNAGKWEIGSGKQTLRLACLNGKLEQVFVEPRDMENNFEIYNYLHSLCPKIGK